MTGLSIVRQPDQPNHFLVQVNGQPLGIVSQVEGGYRLDGFDGWFGDFKMAVIYLAGSRAGRLRVQADQIADSLVRALADGLIQVPR